MRISLYLKFERNFKTVSTKPAPVMASQNVAPSSISSSKGSSSCLTAPKDGHSVTKRLRQDLMKLMVRLNSFSYTLCVDVSLSRADDVQPWRLCLP